MMMMMLNEAVNDTCASHFVLEELCLILKKKKQNHYHNLETHEISQLERFRGAIIAL